MIEILKKYMDKLIFIIALAILAGGILSVIHNNNTSTTVGSSGSTALILNFYHWWDEYLGEETLLELKNNFEALHENISLVFHKISYGEMIELLFNAEPDMAKPEPGADIYALDMLWIPMLIEKGLVDEQLQSSLHEPLLSFINLLYYNIDLLTEAGFVMPPRTRTQFLQYARTVRNSNANVWALGMAFDNYSFLFDDVFPWIWFSGTQLIRNGTATINTRQLIDSLEFISLLYNDDLISPNALSASHSDKLNDFISGRTAFMIAGEIYIRMIREQMGEASFSVSSLPVPDNYAGRTFYSNTAWTAGINPASLNTDAALLFVNYLYERQEFLAEKAGTISAGSLPRPDSDPHYSKVWDIAIAAEFADDFSGAAWLPLEEIFREHFILLLRGDLNPTQAAAAIQREWSSSM